MMNRVSASHMLVDASLDQSIEQFPARHRIGVRAYHAYSQASHMANGRFWLIPLGIGGTVLTLAAAIWATTLDLSAGRSLPVFLADGLAVSLCPLGAQFRRVGGVSLRPIHQSGCP